MPCNIVYCPIEALGQDVVVNETRIAGVAGTKEAKKDCGSFLKIVHATESDLVDIHTIKLGGNRREYPNIRKGFPLLKKNLVLHVEADGCECWEVYTQPRFIGEKDDIVPGDRHYLKVRAGSIRKVKCEQNDYEQYYYSEDEDY